MPSKSTRVAFSSHKKDWFRRDPYIAPSVEEFGDLDARLRYEDRALEQSLGIEREQDLIDYWKT